MITYQEFESEFKKHHICGIPYIPYELAYSSDCPKCEPNSDQWKDTCKEFYDEGRVVYREGFWYKETNEYKNNRT